MKKILSSILTLCMLVTLLPTGAFAAEDTSNLGTTVQAPADLETDVNSDNKNSEDTLTESSSNDDTEDTSNLGTTVQDPVNLETNVNSDNKNSGLPANALTESSDGDDTEDTSNVSQNPADLETDANNGNKNSSLSTNALAALYSGGDGTSDNPYLIATVQDIADLAANVNGGNYNYDNYFRLTNDITISGAFTPIGGGYERGVTSNAFSGYFDGNAHTITFDNVTPTGGKLSLFGMNGGTITNLTIAGHIVINDDITWVGAICGDNYGTIINCINNAAITAKEDANVSPVIGGICGLNSSGTISGCINTGAISNNTNSSDTGGICGQNFGHIIDCHNSAVVRGCHAVGGLCGLIGRDGTLVDSSNSGAISGIDSVDGICGVNLDGGGTITNCTNTGTVTVDGDNVDPEPTPDTDNDYTGSFDYYVEETSKETEEDETENKSNDTDSQEEEIIEEPVIEEQEYIYDATDHGTGVILNADNLNNVTDEISAADAVRVQVESMTAEQKDSATGIDLITLYAETAIAKAASRTVSGNDILINAAAAADLEAAAKQAKEAVSTALVNGNVAIARYLANTITLKTDETGEISIRIDPDILTTTVDKIRVETPTYALNFKVDDLAADLTEILTFTAQDIGSGFAPGKISAITTVKVNLPKGKTTNTITLSLPSGTGDKTYKAVVNTEGAAKASKYNPATTAMDGWINTSGSYTVQTNQRDFTDIGNKCKEMQTAIRYLTSKGIINGTTATTFSPDNAISRAEVAALIINALGKNDVSAVCTFSDVSTNNWYYPSAAAAQKNSIINGYEDNTFRGTTVIPRIQILSISANVLATEMGYKAPSNSEPYLSKYSDSVNDWAQPAIALATKENLVVYRVDGTFSGDKDMTRGDAAIVLYRLFQKIW